MSKFALAIVFGVTFGPIAGIVAGLVYGYLVDNTSFVDYRKDATYLKVVSNIESFL